MKKLTLIVLPCLFLFGCPKDNSKRDTFYSNLWLLTFYYQASGLLNENNICSDYYTNQIMYNVPETLKTVKKYDPNREIRYYSYQSAKGTKIKISTPDANCSVWVAFYLCDWTNRQTSYYWNEVRSICPGEEQKFPLRSSSNPSAICESQLNINYQLFGNRFFFKILTGSENSTPSHTENKYSCDYKIEVYE